ncbi:NAD(P)-binding protein [Polychaeton citri CBS 116435]|uniref:NAD(P)-binding protein n=1 Tax=Polychaeton citri CBS 116435 TaxID=1314669 RepID=A0A9P4Q4T8_9PEZI|nr:NAD(P)-binding protein [Polychaeton citri CBS 116435]
MLSIAIFGANGFIGAPLSRAIKQAHPDWKVTAYVRSTQATEFLKSSLQADSIIVGDFGEFEKIKAVSKEHDIVVNAGNSFTSEPITAIVAGLKENQSSIKGKLIHISGAGNFIDFGTSGNFNPDSKVWNDDREDDIRLVNKDMFNGQSDTVVLDAGVEGTIDTYIVCPSVVYGGASYGAAGIGIGYNLITGNAKPLGYVPYVGEGSAILSTVHVLDLIDFILRIADIAAQGPAQGSAYSRFYMLETARVSWKQVATELAKIMHTKGIFQSPKPKAVPFEQAGEGEVKHLVAANMLIKGDRASRLGFQPRHPTILTQIHDDLKDAKI